MYSIGCPSHRDGSGQVKGYASRYNKSGLDPVSWFHGILYKKDIAFLTWDFYIIITITTTTTSHLALTKWLPVNRKRQHYLERLTSCNNIFHIIKQLPVWGPWKGLDTWIKMQNPTENSAHQFALHLQVQKVLPLAEDTMFSPFTLLLQMSSLAHSVPESLIIFRTNFSTIAKPQERKI